MDYQTYIPINKPGQSNKQNDANRNNFSNHNYDFFANNKFTKGLAKPLYTQNLAQEQNYFKQIPQTAS